MNNNDNQPTACRLMRLREVLHICGMSRTSLYRVMKAHEFPTPVKLSARSIGWRQDEVLEWVENRSNSRSW